MARSIESIAKGSPFHWVGDGFRVHNYLPSVAQGARRLSPFFLLDYHPPFVYPATDNLRRGVGPHPHRGFETVTVAFAGAVSHHDSAGNSGVINPGDVQWMTAGAGILHKEYHEAAFARAGGTLHMLQLWVNLPSAHKMTQPKYQEIAAAQIGRADLPQGAGVVRVIAGAYGEVRGPASTFTPIDLYEVILLPGGAAKFTFPAQHNTALLITKGKLMVGTATAEAEDFVLLANDAEDFAVQALTEEVTFVVLSGRPIDEPIASAGPFLMNTRAELMQAMQDFNAGKFGELPD